MESNSQIDPKEKTDHSKVKNNPDLDEQGRTIKFTEISNITDQKGKFSLALDNQWSNSSIIAILEI